MNWKQLEADIVSAARESFSALFANHGEETFYAFALYTDADCYTVVPAANSLQRYQQKLARLADHDAGSLAYYRWASAEWAYEAFSASPFNPICERLAGACSALSGDPAAFIAFKSGVHQAMIGALARLAREGFFGARRDAATLFITSSDADEALALEDHSALILNPPACSEAFLRRYAGAD